MLTKIVDYLAGEDKFLPAPAGSWNVGYVDIMTEGAPEVSSYSRLYYPTKQPHSQLPERCPKWTGEDNKHGFITFMQSMIQKWPSWVNNSEFGVLGPVKVADKLAPGMLHPLFSAGWDALADNLRIPAVHQAQLATEESKKWPVVVFSHGMGCNRSAYSKVCYDLASEGVVVLAVEHREGSASNSVYLQDGVFTKISHRKLTDSENEYEERNKQMQRRVAEVVQAVDVLAAVNIGLGVDNVLPQEEGYDLSAFAGKLDLDQLYVMGHSYGGSTALLVGARDDRIRGVIALDPWMFPVAEEVFSLAKPALVINTELFVNEHSVAKLKAVVDPAQSVARVLSGAVHLVHVDAPLLFRNEVVKMGLGMACSRPTEAVLAENHRLVWGWLSKVLSGKSVKPVQKWS